MSSLKNMYDKINILRAAYASRHKRVLFQQNRGQVVEEGFISQITLNLRTPLHTQLHRTYLCRIVLITISLWLTGMHTQLMMMNNVNNHKSNIESLSKSQITLNDSSRFFNEIKTMSEIIIKAENTRLN